jgi:hypothetical protein
VVLEALDGPTPYRAGDRVIIRETIRDAGLHNGPVASVKRVQGRSCSSRAATIRPCRSTPANSPACNTATPTPNTVSKVRPATPSCTSSTEHVNQCSLVVGMARHTHRYGMHFSADAEPLLRRDGFRWKR